MKCRADTAVNTGKVTRDAQTFVGVLAPQTKVEIILIKPEDIAAMERYLLNFPIKNSSREP